MTKIVLFIVFIGLIGCSEQRTTEPVKGESVQPAATAADPEKEAAQWRETRRARLTSESGWLSLTGLFWLDEGENRVGSAKGADVRLPPRAPEHAATLVKKGSEVQLASPDATLQIDGKAATAGAVKPDTSDSPTVMKIGDINFQVIERGGKLGVRVKDAQAPTRTGFKGLDYFPFDPKLRVEARLEPYTPSKKIPIANVINMTEEMESPGALVFSIDGVEQRLDPVLEEGEKEWFLIFADATSGKETYGAGRYVYAAAPDANGRTVIDFNRSYNPPCAFTPFATCPLPPRQNRLQVRIEAGEKKYAGADH